MPRVAIIAALEREVWPLVKRWRATIATQGPRRLKCYSNHDAVLVCSGIGYEPARRAAEDVIALYRPSVLISAGFAGSLEAFLKPAEIFVPARVIDGSRGTGVDTGTGEGVLVSVEAVLDPAQKACLKTRYRAAAVDMEAAAVAQVAQENGVKFLAAKAVFDTAGFALPRFEAFMDADGRFQTAKYVRHFTIRPWTWPLVYKMAITSSRSSAALCRWLTDFHRASDADDVLSPGLHRVSR